MDTASENFYQTDHDVLYVKGAWILESAANIDATPSNSHITCLDGSGLSQLDTYGAMRLRNIISHVATSPDEVTLQGFDADHQSFLETIWALPTEDTPRPSTGLNPLALLGKTSIKAFAQLVDIAAFAGQFFCSIAALLLHPSRFRAKTLIRHMDEAGVKAIFIVSLLAFLISIVLAYQGATQLKMFGAAIFTIDITAISILREMGVLLTAIMVAGRSGSAFATEIGVMKLREEVDALKTIGLDPFQLLIVPRILALIIMMPILTFIADLCGLGGTYLMSTLLLDVSFSEFLERCYGQIGLNTFLVGIIKAPVFGFLIGLVGTYQGMQVSGSAESVGRLTTVSVVQSIFLVIFADALFSILFSTFGL